MGQSDIIAAIDSDRIAFQAASSIEEVFVRVTHVPSGREKIFKNKTEFKGRSKKKVGGWLGNTNDNRVEKGLEPFPLEDFIIESDREVGSAYLAFPRVDAMVRNILTKCGTDQYILYLGSGKNMRHPKATINEYKGNRDASTLPLNLKEVRKYMVDSLGAIDIPECPKYTNFEADDWVSIMAHSDDKYIQVSSDKDAPQTEGWLYNPDTMEEPFYVPREGVGKVWLNEKGKAKAYGLKSFCLQWITSDNVDNIKPRSLCKAKFGDKGAFALLDPLDTAEELIEACLRKYIEWYPAPVEYQRWDTKEDLIGTWETISDEMGVLLWMLREDGDWFSIERLCTRYKADYTGIMTRVRNEYVLNQVEEDKDG